ncbi:DUF3604 domain-containing protein [Haloplanus halobius]|uniref:DUF3604 domain-containing protein n=1 Tax=Haloplanus halobius TaxID=2934938 RepID=UPI00200CB653|nr:DUF3604 domain-containing protein [Haloplanus sp. XH21]
MTPRLGSGATFLAESRKSVRTFLDNAPSIRQLLESRHREVDALHAILPSTVQIGESATLTVQVWDAYERLVREFGGTVEVTTTDPEAIVPDRLRFGGDDDGWVRTGGITFRTPGTQYVRVEHPASGVTAVSNPVDVTESPPTKRLYWGDIHLHSLDSDGVGRPAAGYRFGRDVMALDVVAYTDHDTMGFFIPPSLQRRRMHDHGFDDGVAAADAANDPGSFVTLPAYEWTQQPNRGGHLNVYFESADDVALFDSMAADSDTYETLWARLDRWRAETGRDALTIPHHSAEAMYPFDFSATESDDELAPLVEVYSQWGSSERPATAGNEKPIGGIASGEVGVEGHYVQDAFALGNRVGMLASSDYHGPLPGHSLLHVPPHVPRRAIRDGLGWGTIWRLWDERSYPGGLVALYADELTRGAVFAALRNRSVYGTTQPARIHVAFSVAGTRLRDDDSRAAVDDPAADRTVEVSVAGTAPLRDVVVVKNNREWRTIGGTTALDADIEAYTAAATFRDDDPITGLSWDADRGTDDDVYYVRVHQADGGTAWAGPLWVGAD